MNGPPEHATIYSLHQWQVPISDEIREHLTAPLRNVYDSNQEDACAHVQRILNAMKRPPLQSVCRVNFIQSSREQVMQGLKQCLGEWIKTRGGDDSEQIMQIRIQPHSILEDTILVDVIPNDTTTMTLDNQVRPHLRNSSTFKGEENVCWSHHRAILCDRFCAEAVLRGSDIFVRGILLADAGIAAGDIVAVYAHLGDGRNMTRGQKMDEYQGECLFLGLGTACCSRSDLFRWESGLGVTMSPFPWERAGPSMPPLSGIMPHAMMPQNLPSIVVTHVLQPQRNDTILDMCAAPGGKTLHLASWTRNEATIVACDRSRRKMLAAGEAFQQAGATCITPLALDTTSCVLEQEEEDGERRSVQSILSAAKTSTKDSLLDVKRFYPESFDRILLDPPCSALGLRPKLEVPMKTIKDLESYAKYQRRFIQQAVTLLKPGGIMTYSTCTFHAMENEEMVAYILNKYKQMELIPIELEIGLPGLPGLGLTEVQRQGVRRFDPSDAQDTIGFFIAKFQKRKDN